MDYLSVYTNAFNIPSYSAEHHIQYDYIIEAILRFNNSSNNIIDIGSGRGHVIKMLNNIPNKLDNYSITSVDLDKFHSQSCNNFIKCNLSNENNRQVLLNSVYDIVICTDVFEHLDKSYIEEVIKLCSKLGSKCVFGIANHSDILNGVELHTIQENDLWWDNILIKYFNIIKKDIFYDGRLYMYVCNSK